MFDTNYYMEKLRKGEYVKITSPDGSTMVLRRGIVGYLVICPLICPLIENTVVVFRRSKRTILSMMDWEVANGSKIDAYTWHQVGRV